MESFGSDTDFDFGFALSDVESADEYPLLAPGEYLLAATSVDLADTRSGTGKLVKVTFTVTEGADAGRLVFENFNVKNPNPEAVRIAMQNIKSWCMACGVPESERVTMTLLKSLINVEFVGKVKVSPAKGDYDAQNRIKKYSAKTSVTPQTQAALTQTAPALAQPDRAGKKPWEA